MEKLFEEVDNLNMFIHPKFNEKFEFMNDKQSIELAKKVLNEFIKSKFRNIVVIESGTSPLIQIIKGLEEYKTSNISLMQIKIPRDLKFNLYEWFETYLNNEELEEEIEYKSEKKSRRQILKNLCKQIDLEKFVGKEKFTIYDSIKDNRNYDNQTSEIQKVLEGTKLYEIFNNQFLLFDEYINAGTIIRNFNAIVRLFTDKPNFKLSAYCIFLDKPEDYNKIAFTLYDNSTELKCYRSGAYPFENRIDLIGYYYFITEEHFEKIYLEDVQKEINENTVVWVDDDQPKLIPVARIPKAPINFTWLDFGSHAGTHIDAPYYLFNEKWKSDEVPFEILMGDCQVIDLCDVDDYIEVSDLKKHDIVSERILLKTKN